MAGKLYATFVLPAPNGCNLHCPFCIVAKRKEADESVLTPTDYLEFFADLLRHYPINRMSLQGYEPLLPESWPLTKALLTLAARFCCEASLITNGTYLPKYASEVAALTDSVTISLDSADARIHDRLRRARGAHEAALIGIRAIRKEFKGYLGANSVLFPGREEYLDGMIDLLADLGIREWIISPLLRINGTSPDYEAIQNIILEKAKVGEKRGVRVLLANEVRQV